MSRPLAEIDALARALLYEGYALYPYRRDALKNRQRLSFGGLIPRAFARATEASDPYGMRCTFIVEGTPETRIEGSVRGLQPVRRTVARPGCHAHDPPVEVPSTEVEGVRLVPWTEARETSHALPTRTLGELEAGKSAYPPIELVGDIEHEPVLGADGRLGALNVRTRRALRLSASITATFVEPGVARVVVEVENSSDLGDGPQDSETLELATFASAHVLLEITDGAFASAADPPPDLRVHVRECRNERTWPILVGPPGSRAFLLCSPILVEDHPQIAAESPGDLFDATENDELLTLSILAMSDEERRHMAALDPRTRALLARTEALSPERVAALHGVIRSMRRVDVGEDAARPSPASLVVGGRVHGPGDRVRLRPSARADVVDLALADRVAKIESIEHDAEGRCWATVTIDDDPGRDLGLQGHRLFFFDHELAPLGEEGS